MQIRFNPKNSDNVSIEIHSGGGAASFPPDIAAEVGAKDGWHGFPAQASEAKLKNEANRQGHENFGQPALLLEENEQRQAQCETEQTALDARRHAHQQEVAARPLVLEPIVAQPISWVKATVNMVLTVALIAVSLIAAEVTPTWLGLSALALGAALLLINWPMAGSLLRNALALTRYGYQTLSDQVMAIQLKVSARRINQQIAALNERQIELNTKQRELETWIAQQTERLLSEYRLHRQWAEKAVHLGDETAVHLDTDVMPLATRSVTANRQNGFAGYVADGSEKNTPQQTVKMSGASP